MTPLLTNDLNRDRRPARVSCPHCGWTATDERVLEVGLSSLPIVRCPECRERFSIPKLTSSFEDGLTP